MRITIRLTLLAAATALAAGAGMPALAQTAPTAQTGTKNTPFGYQLKGGVRVDKPDRSSTKPDGTKVEEFDRGGGCVTIKETRPDGSKLTSDRCN